MCGIVGYVGQRACQPLLLDALQKLEYRGYDSAGIALLEDDAIRSVRSVGNLARLREAVAERHGAGGVAVATQEATCGIGHTRWATHGRVSERNAHPHADPSGRFQIVLNGIVENHAALRARLDPGAFASETDAEVVAHLLAHHYDGDLGEAVRRTCHELDGHYAFAAMSAAEPGLLVATRRECPLVIGVGEGEHHVASSVNALLAHSTRVVLLEDGDVATITASSVHVTDAQGATVLRPVAEAEGDDVVADKADHETYMLKEIHEQPDAVAATLTGRLSERGVCLPEVRDVLAAAPLRRVVIVGCGTSYHAGLVGRYAIEEWVGLPVDIDVASEFRYRTPSFGEGDLVIGLTQSGETADTLAALRLARRRGATVLAVTNVAGSQVTREADAVLETRAGTEVGVAATKTYLAQVIAMYLLALELAQARRALPAREIAELTAELTDLPDLLRRTLATAQPPARAFAERWARAPFFLYLGRHVGLPVALEGALKLKEVSYVPTDAYAAGEMKHGPIALLDDTTPVVCVATDSPVLRKLLSNVAEVRARGASVLAIATEGSKQAAEHAGEVLYVPPSHWLLQPVLAAVPLQLIAYHVARRRGLDVDQPRNLAKTVTVE